MIWNKVLFLNLALFVNVVVPQGTPWNAEETTIIKEKISKIFIHEGKRVWEEFSLLHPELSYEKTIVPNAAKVKYE